DQSRRLEERKHRNKTLRHGGPRRRQSLHCRLCLPPPEKITQKQNEKNNGKDAHEQAAIKPAIGVIPSHSCSARGFSPTNTQLKTLAKPFIARRPRQLREEFSQLRQ